MRHLVGSTFVHRAWVLVLLSCGGVSPTPTPDGRHVVLSVETGSSCASLHAAAARAHDEGRLDSALRDLDDADARCPSERGKSSALRATTLAELAEPGDGATIFARARRARAANHPVEARRELSHALAAFERELGGKVAVGAPAAAFTQSISATRKLVAFGREKEILVYDPTTWLPYRRLAIADPDPHVYIRSAAVSPDATKIAASYGANSFVVWDVESGKIERTFVGHTKEVGEVGWSANSRTVVSDGSDNTIRTWEASTGRLLQSIAVPNLSTLVVTPRDQIVVGGFGGPISVIDLASGQRVRSIPGPPGSVSNLELSADGRTLAVSVDDSPNASVHLYDFAGGRRLRSFSLVGRGTLSPDGKLLAGSHETGFKIIDLGRGVPIVESKKLERPRFLPDGSLIALDGEGGVVSVDPKTGAVRPIAPTARAASRIEFGPAARFAVRTRSGIELCDLAPALDCRELTGDYRDIAYDATGQTLAAIRDDNGSVDVWNAKLEKTLSLLTTPKDHMIPQHNAYLRMSRDGRRAVTTEYQLHILDLAAGKEVPSVKLDGHNGLAISADGKLAATPWGPNAEVYDLERGVRSNEFKLPAEPRGLAFSPNSKLLAAGSHDTLSIIDLASGAITATAKVDLEKHSELSSIAFDADGRRVVAAFGRFARIYELPSLRPIATLSGHANPVFGVAVRPDGRVVATASTDGLLRLWSIDGKPLLSIGFVEGDSAYALDASRHHVELYGNAAHWLTCDIGGASFPFELCADRVTLPGLTAALGNEGLPPLPKVASPPPGGRQDAKYRRDEDIVFGTRPGAASLRLIETTRYQAWFSTDGKTVLTTGGSTGSIVVGGSTQKLDVADGFEITLSPDETRASIVQARAPLSVVTVPGGKRVWEHANGLGCAARWASPTTLIVHDDGNDGFLWRVDLTTGRSTKLGDKRRADACWASSDGKRWFVRDDFAKRGGVVWRIDGTTGTAAIWLENVDDLVGSKTADRFCYKRRSTNANRLDEPVFCRAENGVEERVADEGYGLQLDDTGHTLLFGTRGVFFVADTTEKTVRGLSTVVGHSGGVQAVLSGGDAIATGSATGVEVFDLRAKTKLMIPGSAFYGVRAIPGRPRSLTIEKEVNNLQDLYLAELPP